MWDELPGGNPDPQPSGHLGTTPVPTVDEGPVQPLDVVVLGEGEQHLVADDGEGQQEDGAQRHGQGEGAQSQPAGEPSVGSGTGSGPPKGVNKPVTAPQGHRPQRAGGTQRPDRAGRGSSRASRRQGAGWAGTYAILLTAASSSSCTAGGKKTQTNGAGGGRSMPGALLPACFPVHSQTCPCPQHSQGVWALLPSSGS